jgi:pSer/pThr/pTyr-binding forkhead associated (FHA) protein
MATLIVTTGPCEGKTYPLEASSLISVGRDDQCSFQLVDDEVSRRHLQIRFDPDKRVHFAVDMRSANGVFVNGERLTVDHQLGEGDVIRIGRSEIRYTEDDVTDIDLALDKYKKTDEWKRGTTF